MRTDEMTTSTRETSGTIAGGFDAALSRVRLKALAVFAVVLVAGGGTIFWVDQAEIEAHKREAVEAASLHGHLLQQQLVRSLSATYALAAMLKQGNGEIRDFEALAREMMPMYGGLSSLQLAPNGVISQIVPLAGNEAAIGHNLLDDPERNKEAFLSLRSRALTLAGPFELRQGGQAVVGRLPVFLDAGQPNEHFWGFATAVIRIPDLLRASALDDRQVQGYELALTRTHPDTRDSQTIWATAILDLADAVSYDLAVPNGNWHLHVVRAGGWHTPILTLTWLALAVLLISVLSSFLAYLALRQPARMAQEIAARTAALNEANESLQAEIFQHWQTEMALRDGERRLEGRVQERTHELEAANEALIAEKARQKELIDKLADTRAQLLQSQMMAAVGQLAAGVAHEINNPMSFISSNVATMKTYVESLIQGRVQQMRLLEPHLADQPELLAMLASTEQEVDVKFILEEFPSLVNDTLAGLARVKRIVSDLREFSSVDRSAWQRVDLNHSLECIVSLMANDFGERIVVTRAYGDLPTVHCNAPQIAQLVRSLLLNAVQAIAGEGEIDLTTRAIDDGVEIEIADSGEGIEAEHLGRIFEPFFSTRVVGEGVGLGLSVAYHVVKRHGGDILVSSEPGQGSRFTVRLPLNPIPLPDAE